MARSTDLKDALEHVRLVHFSLLAALGVVTYFLYATRADTPRLVAELDALAEIADGLGAGDAAMLRKELSTDVSAARATLAEAVSAAAGHPVGISSAFASDRFGKPTGWEYQRRDPLWKLLRSLETARWQIFHAVPARGGETDELRAWLAEGSAPRIVAVTWGDRASGGTMEVTVEADFREVRFDPDPSMAKLTRLQRDSRQKVVRLPAEWHAVTVGLPEGWLARRLPVLGAHHVSFQDRPIEDARRRAEHIEEGTLAGEKQVIAGIEVRGRHLVVAGPVLMMILLTYLLAYLWELERCADRGLAHDEPRPWVGVISNRWAVALTWGSLVVAPAIVLRALTTTVPLGPSFRWLLIAAPPVLGALAAWRANRVRRRLDAAIAAPAAPAALVG
jgi:hypothetical protein